LLKGILISFEVYSGVNEFQKNAIMPSLQTLFLCLLLVFRSASWGFWTGCNKQVLQTVRNQGTFRCQMAELEVDQQSALPFGAILVNMRVEIVLPDI